MRNCPGGRVDAHIEGEPEAVEQLIEKLKAGPPAAEVEDLRSWDVEPCDFDNFEVRH